ncbi:MAG: flavin reductase family protein [Pseudorhodobacter sp.]
MTHPSAAAFDTRAFRDALGRFSTGIVLVTIEGEEGPEGFVANSFASVSLDPPLVLWSPARAASRFDDFATARHFAIHVLGQENATHCQNFARRGMGFQDLPFSRNDEGVPVLPGTLARFECEQHATHDGGDHLIVLGRVLRFTAQDGAPLLFSQGRFAGLTSQG